jgi:hypothetical protein
MNTDQPLYVVKFKSGILADCIYLCNYGERIKESVREIDKYNVIQLLYSPEFVFAPDRPNVYVSSTTDTHASVRELKSEEDVGTVLLDYVL